MFLIYRGLNKAQTPILQPSTTPTSENNFGLMVGSGGRSFTQGPAMAKSMGVTYYRPLSILLNQGEKCNDCASAAEEGPKLSLVVRNSSAGAPPPNLLEYKNQIGQILDEYRPAILVVENEADGFNSFLYRFRRRVQKQLDAACEAAHSKGFKCANGGLTSQSTAPLANNFALRAFTEQERRFIPSPQATQRTEKATAFYQVIRSSNVDYINFHWYIPDTQAMEEAVSFLRKDSGKTVITDEVGQWNEDPKQVTNALSKILELKLPIGICFSLDAAQAHSLFNADGSLRPNGEAFKNFMVANFGTK